MRRLAFSLLSATVLAAGAPLLLAQNDTPVKTQSQAANAAAYAFPALGTAPNIDQPGIEKMLREHGSDLLVVNFWATWCGPCVEELPYFIKVSGEHPPERVRFVGLSGDVEAQRETKLIPFLKEKGVPYPNYLLDVDADALITSLSKEWSGAFPATFLVAKDGTIVREILTEVNEAELREAISAELKKIDEKKKSATKENPENANPENSKESITRGS